MSRTSMEYPICTRRKWFFDGLVPSRWVGSGQSLFAIPHSSALSLTKQCGGKVAFGHPSEVNCNIGSTIPSTSWAAKVVMPRCNLVMLLTAQLVKNTDVRGRKVLRAGCQEFILGGMENHADDSIELPNAHTPRLRCRRPQGEESPGSCRCAAFCQPCCSSCSPFPQPGAQASLRPRWPRRPRPPHDRPPRRPGSRRGGSSGRHGAGSAGAT